MTDQFNTPDIPAVDYDDTPAGKREKADDLWMNKHFASTHKELPYGRNFRFFNRVKDVRADRKFRSNFDTVFPNSPGAGL